jgi:hypothetical protein
MRPQVAAQAIMMKILSANRWALVLRLQFGICNSDPTRKSSP